MIAYDLNSSASRLETDKLIISFIEFLRGRYRAFNNRIVWPLLNLIVGQILLILSSPFILLIVVGIAYLGYKMRRHKKSFKIETPRDYHRVRAVYTFYSSKGKVLNEIYNHKGKHTLLVWLLVFVCRKVVGSTLHAVQLYEAALNAYDSKPKSQIFYAVKESELWTSRTSAIPYRF